MGHDIRRASAALLFFWLFLAACGVPQDEHDSLKQNYQDSLDEVSRLTDLVAAMEASGAELETQLSTTAGDLEQAQADLGDLETERDELAASLAESETGRLTLSEELEALNEAHAALLLRVDGIEELVLRESALEVRVANLESEADSLRDDIQAMQQERQALIPQTHTTSFICSGSMDPVITCMDEAVWLTNFDPADIVVGSVISFDASSLEDCAVSGPNIAHRVTGIMSQNGQLLFRTKGDNNTADDDCWIPAANVHSYIVELVKHDFPEMRELLEVIWELEASQKTLRESIAELQFTYNHAARTYTEQRDRFCTFNGTVWQCSPGEYERVIGLYNEVQTAWTNLNSMITAYRSQCALIRSMRIELQELRDQRFGQSDYVFPEC